MERQRTITELLNLKGRVYVYCANKAVAQRFMQDAENECFLFADGVNPTQRQADDIFAIYPNHTLNYVGWAGHMAFKSPKAVVGGPLIRVDYIRYITGEKKFLWKK